MFTRNKIKALILIAGAAGSAGTGLTACTILDRREMMSSTNTDVEDFYRSRREQRLRTAQEELGYGVQAQDQELGENEARAIQLRAVLRRLEERLESSLDRKQYFEYKPYFRSDVERIQFLQLPNRDARDRYASYLGVATAEKQFDPMTTSLIEKGDLMKGMSRQAVEQSWGEPDLKEYAGEPMYGNERWHYKKQVSSEDGYRYETRVIYFEGGRVGGWETLSASRTPASR
jgi:hypothetical protein